jgi:hypothetical protein
VVDVNSGGMLYCLLHAAGRMSVWGTPRVSASELTGLLMHLRVEDRCATAPFGARALSKLAAESGGGTGEIWAARARTGPDREPSRPTDAAAR